MVSVGFTAKPLIITVRAQFTKKKHLGFEQNRGFHGLQSYTYIFFFNIALNHQYPGIIKTWYFLLANRYNWQFNLSSIWAIP